MPSEVQIIRLRKAAHDGDANAQYELACRYANGRGVPQDNPEAAKWYQNAAEQGHADAQNNLGWMYETGRGVPMDVAAAIEWYRKAAAQGKEPAIENLARLAPRKKPPSSPRQFTLPLDGTVVGSCPKCGSDVLELDAEYCCKGRECRFKLKGIILSQVIAPAQASKLLHDGRTDLLSGFVSAKSGRQFSAWLVLDEAGKITFEFPKQEPQEATPIQFQTQEAVPPQTAEKQRPRSSGDCKPLLDAATKDLFRNNAFRITGLSVEATDPEVKKHAHKLKLMADVNRTAAVHTGAVALQPPPTPDQIREATGRLIKDPEVRLIDEFFWFWPCEPGRTAPDPALEALASGNDAAALKIWTANETNANSGVVATHNIALLWHLRALDLEPDNAAPEADPAQVQALENYWRNSLQRWKYLTSDDLLWDKVASRVRQLGDQRLTGGFVRQMRATLPLALAKVNAELALVPPAVRTIVRYGNLAGVTPAAIAAATLVNATGRICSPLRIRSKLRGISLPIIAFLSRRGCGTRLKSALRIPHSAISCCVSPPQSGRSWPRTPASSSRPFPVPR